MGITKSSAIEIPYYSWMTSHSNNTLHTQKRTKDLLEFLRIAKSPKEAQRQRRPHPSRLQGATMPAVGSSTNSSSLSPDSVRAKQRNGIFKFDSVFTEISKYCVRGLFLFFGLQQSKIFLSLTLRSGSSLLFPTMTTGISPPNRRRLVRQDGMSLNEVGHPRSNMRMPP